MTRLRTSTPTLRAISPSHRFVAWSALRPLTGIVVLATVSLLVPAVAAEPQPTADASVVALEQLRAANVARAELAREEAAWKSERERLQAAIAATRAEAARLEHDAAESAALRDDARAKLAALEKANELDAVRTRLGEAGITLRSALKSLATTVPPGVITVPTNDLAGEDLFDAAVRALEAAERAAGTLGVEVVSGNRAGQSEAVKLLRVAGAAAWWVSLDGKAAGIARMADGKLHLDAAQDEPTRLAITAALAQAEGRAHPTVVLLPAPTTAGNTP